jgi:hypothetical protein
LTPGNRKRPLFNGKKGIDQAPFFFFPKLCKILARLW